MRSLTRDKGQRREAEQQGCAYRDAHGFARRDEGEELEEDHATTRSVAVSTNLSLERSYEYESL